MVVRVTKPAFNLRDKLSQLDNPVGAYGGELLRAKTSQEVSELVRLNRKNMIINGQTWINQRNGTSSWTVPHGTDGNVSTSYGAPDRWGFQEATDGSLSVNMDSDCPPEFHTGKSMQIACTGTGALSSTHNAHFYQNIEGYNTRHLKWGTEYAKPVTLSFWAKTNKGGIYCVGLENNDVNRCNIREFHLRGNVYEWQKIVLTFKGSSNGTWKISNTIGMRVRFCLASGSNFHISDNEEGTWLAQDELCTPNQVNFMDSTNNRFFISGIQLEEGTVATPFEHRSYGEELALCQRYYQQIDGTGDLTPFAFGRANGSTNAEASVPLTVPLRGSPTILCAANTAWDDDGGHTSSTNPGVGRWTANATVLHATFSGHSGLTNARACNVHSSSSSNFEMSSEL